MAHIDKHIEVYQYSPSTWWVSHREYIGGKLWQHDTSMNLSEAEAMASARRRAAVSGLDILIVQELAQTRQNEVPLPGGKYHNRMVEAPINQGKSYPAIYQWTDEHGEWYTVNGLRCEAKEIQPWLHPYHRSA